MPVDTRAGLHWKNSIAVRDGFPKTRSLRLLTIVISSWAILQNPPTYSVGFPAKRQFCGIDSIRMIALKSFSVKSDATKAERERERRGTFYRDRW